MNLIVPCELKYHQLHNNKTKNFISHVLKAGDLSYHEVSFIHIVIREIHDVVFSFIFLYPFLYQRGKNI